MKHVIMLLVGVTVVLGLWVVFSSVVRVKVLFKGKVKI